VWAQRKDLRQPAATVLLVLAWGSTFAAVKTGLQDAPPILFTGLRSILGGGVIAALALVRVGAPPLRQTWRIHSVLTLLNVVLFFGLQTFAILDLPSGLAAVLIYLQPVLVGVLAWPLLGEAMSGPKVVGLVLGFGGILVVSAGAFSGNASVPGVMYAVTSALMWALGTIAFKKVHERVNALWAVAIPFLTGGFVLTGVGLVVEGDHVNWSAKFVFAFFYASLVGTALAWALWFGLVESGEASRASAYIFFVPLVSLLIGGVFLGESLGPSLLAGAAMVVAAVYLVSRPRKIATSLSPHV
jgi:O-acetylserine/cysteine efflux transporter